VRQQDERTGAEMSDPVPYSRTYSFTDYQAGNPSAPLPGIQVDNELENVEQSLGEAIDAIKDVRRSDGALKNGIVTVDSLDPTVAAGVGSGALASAEAAAASADAASDSAVAAAASATAASGSATAASGYASDALTSRNEASGFSDDSAAAASLSQTARDYASKWATEAEGVDVDDGVNPVGKSAYHWAQVALDAAAGSIADGSVTTAKLADGALSADTTGRAKMADGFVTSAKIADGTIARAKLATAVTDELDGKADLASVNAFTKTQVWSKGADVASAAALTLGDDGNYFDVTGTMAITSIATVGVGTVIKLHFDGALTLTHHATDLVLPGGANITTAAGDEAEFVEYAAGDWRCVNYERASTIPFEYTNWTAYTPTFTGFGTVSAATVFWKRIGDTLHIRGRFTLGTTTATEARMSLPSGLTSSGSNGGLHLVGSMTSTFATAGSFNVLCENSVAYVTFGVQNGSFGGFLKRDGNAIGSSGQTLSFSAEIQIDGW
jgi:hypothetical protein